MAQSDAERARAYRQRNGAGTTRGPAPVRPCGTLAAYRRHVRHGEPVDEACAAVWAEYQRDYVQRRI